MKGLFYGDKMLFVFLTNQFYEDYTTCNEIEQKSNRPYILVLVKLHNIDFAIPLRSNIKHSYVFWTDKDNGCGLDFSKAVVITDKNKYIDYTVEPQIRQVEFNALKGKDIIIKRRMVSYINKYKKALNEQNIARNRMLCNYSALQYFHDELGIK